MPAGTDMSEDLASSWLTLQMEESLLIFPQKLRYLKLVDCLRRTYPFLFIACRFLSARSQTESHCTVRPTGWWDGSRAGWKMTHSLKRYYSYFNHGLKNWVGYTLRQDVKFQVDAPHIKCNFVRPHFKNWHPLRPQSLGTGWNWTQPALTAHKFKRATQYQHSNALLATASLKSHAKSLIGS